MSIRVAKGATQNVIIPANGDYYLNCPRRLIPFNMESPFRDSLENI